MDGSPDQSTDNSQGESHVRNYDFRMPRVIAPVEDPQNIPVRKKVYTCEICQKTHLTKKSFDLHIASHAGLKKPRPYHCKYCGKNFESMGYLTAHERIHTGERPYSCRYCNKKFTWKGNVTNHEKTHNKEKPYRCKYCNKMYGTSGSVKTHERLHNSDRVFCCSYCPSQFRHKNALIIHEQVHVAPPYDAWMASRENGPAYIPPQCSNAGATGGNDHITALDANRGTLVQANNPEGSINSSDSYVSANCDRQVGRAVPAVRESEIAEKRNEEPLLQNTNQDNNNTNNGQSESSSDNGNLKGQQLTEKTVKETKDENCIPFIVIVSDEEDDVKPATDHGPNPNQLPLKIKIENVHSEAGEAPTAELASDSGVSSDHGVSYTEEESGRENSSPIVAKGGVPNACKDLSPRDSKSRVTSTESAEKTIVRNGKSLKNGKLPAGGGTSVTCIVLDGDGEDSIAAGSAANGQLPCDSSKTTIKSEPKDTSSNKDGTVEKPSGGTLMSSSVGNILISDCRSLQGNASDYVTHAAVPTGVAASTNVDVTDGASLNAAANQLESDPMDLTTHHVHGDNTPAETTVSGGESLNATNSSALSTETPSSARSNSEPDLIVIRNIEKSKLGAKLGKRSERDTAIADGHRQGKPGTSRANHASNKSERREKNRTRDVEVPEFGTLVNTLDSISNSPNAEIYGLMMANGENNKDENSSRKCDLCGIGYTDLMLYLLHRGFHGPEGPFHCSACGKICRDSVEFNIHLSSHPLRH
ncbi:uncharacterized protein [Ptychodera flava]|uniref:uncharacterized protein n=1 Tax=Ptychodera flava TaxID=63121 RepID=UPI00396A6038